MAATPSLAGQGGSQPAPLRAPHVPDRDSGWLLSQSRLRWVLGLLWLADGLFLLQPRMIAGAAAAVVLAPQTAAQPPFLAPVLRSIADTVSRNANAHLVDFIAAAVQIQIGVLLLRGAYVRATLAASIVWAILVWFAGEGFGGIFTGRASVLSGAPGPVLLYALLALAVYPRRRTPDMGQFRAGRPPRLLFLAVLCVLGAQIAIIWCLGQTAGGFMIGRYGTLSRVPGLLMVVVLTGAAVFPWGVMGRARSGAPLVVVGREHLRFILAAFWASGALLQMEPFWWAPGRLAGLIRDQVGQGGLDGVFLDRLLQWAAGLASGAEVPVNVVLMLVFAALGVSLAFAPNRLLPVVLGCAVGLAMVIWVIAQGAGLIFSGATTDFDSGLLLALLACACWPRKTKTNARLRDAGR